MVDQRFNNQIEIDMNIGFRFGGNESNCGTSMDKMESSDKAKRYTTSWLSCSISSIMSNNINMNYSDE